MTARNIIITAEDHQRLTTLLGSARARFAYDYDRIKELREELKRAQVVPQANVPHDVVTMNSTFTLRDLNTGEVEDYTLVYPDRADISNHKLSVLAPGGTAILGYRVGDELAWPVSTGCRQLKVEQVFVQLDGEKTFHLQNSKVHREAEVR